jgi:hypothetical protein
VKAEGFEITTGADELEGDAPIWTYMLFIYVRPILTHYAQNATPNEEYFLIERLPKPLG